MTPLIEVKNLSKSFQHKRKTLSVLKNVNFTIDKGTSLALVGQSGSGKTTIAKILLGLTPSSSGSFLYEGDDVFSFSKKRMYDFRKQVQIIFQSPFSSLNPHMTIEEIILEPFVIHKLYTKEERRRKISKLLDQVGLPQYALKRHPHEFSGGELQRIAIARALALRPQFLICDEALSSLDISIGTQIITLLKDLQKEFGLTYLFITHDLEIAHYFADQIAVLHQGRIVETQGVKEFFNNPKEEYSKELLGSILELNNNYSL